MLEMRGRFDFEFCDGVLTSHHKGVLGRKRIAIVFDSIIVDLRRVDPLEKHLCQTEEQTQCRREDYRHTLQNQSVDEPHECIDDLSDGYIDEDG